MYKAILLLNINLYFQYLLQKSVALSAEGSSGSSSGVLPGLQASNWKVVFVCCQCLLQSRSVLPIVEDGDAE